MTATSTAFAQSLAFQKAKFNLNRARLCLLISEKHCKKAALYLSQLAQHENDWRFVQVLTENDLEVKIKYHQEKAIDYWLMYTKYKLS